MSRPGHTSQSARSPYKTFVLLLALALVAAVVAVAVSQFAPKTAYALTRPALTSTLTATDTPTPIVVCTPRVLWDYSGSVGGRTSSQNFEQANDAYDSAAAADFNVSPGEAWNIQQVVARGIYYNGEGPAESFNVTFYGSDGSHPGSVIAAFDNLAYTTNGDEFTISLSSDVALLPTQTFWISIQANMYFVPNGQWGWTNATSQNATKAHWRNPGGGFSIPQCLNFAERGETCGLDPAFPDQMFKLIGLDTSSACSTATATQTATNTPTATQTATPTLSPTPLPCVTPGTLDTSFNGTGIVTTSLSDYDDTVFSVLTQPDGKIVAVGSLFNPFGGYVAFELARYHLDGSLDTSFNGNGKVITQVGPGNNVAFGAALQSDGKIVAAGSGGSGNSHFALARYNPDGSLDTSFNGTGTVITPVSTWGDGANAVAIQPDGKIVAAGLVVPSFNAGNLFAVLRYNPDGTLDTSFNSTGIVRTGFSTTSVSAESILIQPDGRIVVAGGTGSKATGPVLAMARYNVNGTLDTSFDGDGRALIPDGHYYEQQHSIALQNDGKIVAATGTGEYDHFDFGVFRVNANGSPDTSFNGTGKVIVPIGAGDDVPKSVAIQPDGRIVVAGTTLNTSNDFALIRLNSDGSLDTTFNGTGKLFTPIGNSDDNAYSVAIQPDGRIIAAGESVISGTLDFALVRYYGHACVAPTPTATPVTVSVTVGMNPSSASLVFTVDSVSYTTTQTFNWEVGSQHTISTMSQQGGYQIGALYTWTNWSDGGAVTHTVTADAPATYTANFSTQYWLNVWGGFNSSPPSGWFNAGQVVQISTSWPPYCNFWGWQGWGNGSYTGQSPTAFVTMLGPINEMGNGECMTPTPTFTATRTATATFTPTPTATASPTSTITFTATNTPTATPSPSPCGVPGTLDTTFNGIGTLISPIGSGHDLAYSTALQPDGKIVAAGFSEVGNYPKFAVARYNIDGSFDTSFNGTGKVITSFSSREDRAQAVAVTPDGKIVAAGYGEDSTGNYLGVTLARYNADGSLDTTFGSGGKMLAFYASSANALAIQPDGKILVAANGYGQNRFLIARHTVSGALDTTFNSNGYVTPEIGTSGTGEATAVAIQPDGKIVAVAGASNGNDGTFGIVRFDQTGHLDPSFNLTGVVTAHLSGADAPYSVAIAPDGKIVAAGNTWARDDSDFVTARYNSDGTLDTTFNGTGFVVTNLLGDNHNDYGRAVLVQQDGKIVTVGQTLGPGFAVVRYNADGSLDTSFNGTGKVITQVGSWESGAYSAALLPDGRILAAGYGFGANEDFGFARYWGHGCEFQTPTNTPTFTPTLTQTAPATPTPDGSPIPVSLPSVTGVWFVTVPMSVGDLTGRGVTSYEFTIAYAQGAVAISDVSTDGTLSSGMSVTVTDLGPPPLFGILNVKATGTTPLSGSGTLIKFRVGTLDNSNPRTSNLVFFDYTEPGTGIFHPSFRFNDGNPPAVTTNGWVGISPAVSPTPTATFTRTATATATPTPSRRTAFDYDGDGKSDVSVFRPSESNWYFQNSAVGFLGIHFGLPGDKIAPADYDGDRKTDIAVYRPSDGVWYVLRSSDGNVSYYRFGLSEDLPTPADYDGDGKADISVFRPSSGTWYRQNSSNGSFFAVQFGVSEDKPTVEDFDGDGKADIAVFRPSNGTWYRLNSSDNSFYVEQFGISSDLLTPGDYDGDGKADLAVFRPSTAIWYLKYSSNSYYDYGAFGLPGDIPAHSDFDGDGRADICVFRPSDGTWYWQNSSSGALNAFQFGTNGDMPTQTAFRY